MGFELLHTQKAGKARAGILKTDRGEIETPIFMPVGTLGTVKTVQQYDLKEEVKAQIILGNTYHLYLRPGLDTIQQAGGLHQFIHWDRPMLTDSGGYQVYSLSNSRKIKEEGVRFASHIDGSYHLFTPENAIETQHTIGADVIMAFDECTPYPCKYDYAKRSIHMTHRWLDRCFDTFNQLGPSYGHKQILAPIIQGSIYPDLRKISAEYVLKHESDVYAIGGLSVGEPHEDMYAMTEVCTDIMPKKSARYLMGVGTPENLIHCIGKGIDMFDCVLPTRNARHGLVYTKEGILNMKNAKWKNDFSSFDEQSPVTSLRMYSKAYLRHLFHTKEFLGRQITSMHNLAFYLELMREARKQILEDNFNRWAAEILPKVSRRL